MKTKNILIAVTVTVVQVLILSCHKNGSTSTSGGGQLAGFFQQTQVPSQSFTITGGQFNNITGSKGTQLYIYAGSLLHQNGSAVTGSVQVQLQEIYSHGDMILSNATTTSDSFLLQSGGEIYLTATQNGETLRISHNNPIGVNMPITGSGLSGMQRFTGTVIANNNIAAGSQINWVIVPADTAAAPAVNDTGAGYSYSFVVDSFGWSNCDRFYNLPGGTDPMIQLPTGYDNTNTTVYMIFDAENTVATADRWSSPIYRFHSGSHTPIGLHVTIVAIAKKGSTYYYDIEHEVTASGATFNMNMTQSTLDAIKAAVGQL
jgi:hypothetical protein